MATEDLTTNPMVSSFFYADPTGQGMTYEQLKARRAMAAALAAKSRDYPNTIGKGIFSVGESIGETIRDARLDREEARIRRGDRDAFEKNKELLKASPDTADTPPLGPPGPAAAPAPRAELAPDVDISRAQMAEALMGGAAGSQPAPGPMQTRMASLAPAETMSDAGQPGMTYGGPSPAGPGASMAERPDASPPTPSAPPVPTAGPGATDTPPPPPAMGGGVPPPPGAPPPQGGPMPPPPMAGAAGPQPPVPREMLAQIATANQGANPDAPGPVPPGGGVPPQMLAQVGGFGGGGGPGGSAPMPAPPPGGAPPGAMRHGPLPPGAPGNPLPPEGVRPVIPPELTPPVEEEYVRQFGPRAQAPKPWEPRLREQYNRAMGEALNPDRSDTYRKRFEDAAKRIEAENSRLFSLREGLYKQEVTREGSNYDQVRKEILERQQSKTDPTKIAARDQAIADHQLSLRAGNIPAADVHKELKADQESAKATAQRIEDYQIALDAMNKGVFVGAGAATRLDLAKFTAWATGNEQLSKRAGSTELLKAKLLSTVNSLVKDIKPISNIDIMLGKSQAGDINMEPSAIDALLRQTMGRSYRDLATYDSKAHSLVNGLNPALEARYRSPEASWFQKGHLERLFGNPDAAEAFNQRYGPGAAEFVLNRKSLNPGAR